MPYNLYMPRNDLLLRAIQGENLERFPVWLMRQAGRYMREYRELRAKEKSFLDFCKNVKLAVEVSLLPLRLLNVDALIIFSDILVPLEPMGIKVEFVEGEGPRLSWSGKLSDLKKYEPSENGYVYEIIKTVKKVQDDVPVIGFAGAPFTLASYMIEGSSSKDFKKTKLFMWEKEFEFRNLMERLVESLSEYLVAQARSGADVLQVFDSWSLFLSRTDYEDLVFPYTRALIEEVKSRTDVPLIYFFRGSSSFLELAEQTGADVLSVDWSVDLSLVMLSSGTVFQGNLEPTVLYSNEDTIRLKTLELLRSIPRRSGYIFNLGHGLAPDMDFHKVKLLVDTVRSYTIN